MSEITRTMTVEEVRETLGCEYVPTGRALWLARTALEWLAERDALAERIGLLQVERDTVWNQADTFRAERDAVTVERDEVRNDLSKSRAFARGLSANIVAAEEARDLAIAERDQLRSGLEGEQKSRRKLDAEIRAILHIASDVSVLPVLRERLTEWGKLSRAKKAAEDARDLAVVERDEAYRQRDVQASRVLGMGSMFDDLRTILGAAPEELLSDAAQRVVDAGPHKVVLDAVRDVLGLRLGDPVVDRVRALVKAMGAAKAEPPQVFRPHFEVMIGPDCADRPCATLRLVQPIRDPAFMALTADQLSRLGLVVCDE